VLGIALVLAAGAPGWGAAASPAPAPVLTLRGLNYVALRVDPGREVRLTLE